MIASFLYFDSPLNAVFPSFFQRESLNIFSSILTVTPIPFHSQCNVQNKIYSPSACEVPIE